jgi:hypothetical protein
MRREGEEEEGRGNLFCFFHPDLSFLGIRGQFCALNFQGIGWGEKIGGLFWCPQKIFST